MSLQVLQIEKHLEDNYFSNLDTTDLNNKPPDQILSSKKSRALAAFAINMLCGISPEECCTYVTDSYDDNGIDAIYFSQNNNTLYLIQAKHHHDGNGSIDLGDFNKFLKGCADLIQAKFSKFNKAITNRKEEILSVLMNATNTFSLVVIYSGKEQISKHCQTEADEFLTKNNEIGEKFYFNPINIREIYSFISSGAGQKPINVTIAVHNWNHIEKPLKSVYGLIAGSDLSQWYKDSGPHLFSPNIRFFLGTTDVNTGITHTVINEPENFWYYNNGITVLCDSIEKMALGGDSRETGYFECKNVKVVNGAQTVGTLNSLQAKYQSNLEKVRVWIRLIQTNDEESTSSKITKTNNTQNRIEKRDFVSLDPQQKRIQDQLRLEDIAYIYRTGETADAGKYSFDLNDATVARACFQDDIQHAVQAKREISKLWDDINTAPYKLLFNSGTDGPKLLAEVKLLRIVDTYLEKRKHSDSENISLLLTHGNRFFLYCASQYLKGKIYNSEPNKEEIECALNTFIENANSVITRDYPDSYLASLFKNLSKCRDIYKKINTPITT